MICNGARPWGNYNSCTDNSPPNLRINWALQCAQVLLCNSETACQNEDWPPIFILILANHLGRLLILGICLFSIYLFLLADFFSWRLIT